VQDKLKSLGLDPMAVHARGARALQAAEITK
jgi:hypothetical protein